MTHIQLLRRCLINPPTTPAQHDELSVTILLVLIDLASKAEAPPDTPTLGFATNFNVNLSELVAAMNASPSHQITFVMSHDQHHSSLTIHP